MTAYRILLAAALIFAPCTALAQTDPTGVPGAPTDQTTPGNPHPGTADSSLHNGAGTDAQAMQDKLFLRKAAQGGAAEIQLAQLALKKSTSDVVKKFAQRMIDDHTAINQSLKPFADELGAMTPKPTKMDQQEYDRLDGLAPADFDREYAADMVKNHRKDLQDFTLEADSARNPELKDTVTHDQMLIARHTRMAEKLAAATTATAGNK